MQLSFYWPVGKHHRRLEDGEAAKGSRPLGPSGLGTLKSAFPRPASLGDVIISQGGQVWSV